MDVDESFRAWLEWLGIALGKEAGWVADDGLADGRALLQVYVSIMYYSADGMSRPSSCVTMGGANGLEKRTYLKAEKSEWLGQMQRSRL